jgi:hypothetical protein
LAAAPNLRGLPEAEASAGRLILRRYADAVVVVKFTMVMKITVGDRSPTSSEQKIDLNATMITPQGLTVTSLSGIEPKVLFDSVRTQLASPAVPVELVSSELKGVKLRLGDGSEVPAKVVWKDATRDLAFLAPENPPAGGRTLTCVNLNDAPEAAMLLGDYYNLSRLAEVMQRQPIVRPCTITGIMERPRRQLLINTDWIADVLGCPVFDTKGRVLGICLRYLVDGIPRGIVVVPAADVAASASQMAAL